MRTLWSRSLLTIEHGLYDSLTFELLSNREFVRTLRTYEAGKTKWTKLEDVPE